ncbi:MAG: sensor histidine kinase [Propioniciclava sp.]
MSSIVEEVSGPARAVEQTRVVTAGSRAWIDRAVSLAVLGASAASMLLAWEQFNTINQVWLSMIAGGIVATSALLPVYAWSSRGIRVPATIFAIDVMVGLWTWPIAWQGVPTTNPPFLWMLIGVATLVMSITWNNPVAIGYNLLASAAYLAARLTPSGGGVSALVAVQDSLQVAVQPLVLVAVFTYVRTQAAAVDSWTETSRRFEAEATLRAALEGERSRLDAIIHDEVMTTLVSAGRSGGGADQHLSSQARHALASLDAQAGDDTGVEDFLPGTVARLINDVVASACPTARFTSDVDPLTPRLPHRVVSALARAVREASINSERHAEATSCDVRLVVRRGAEGRAEITVTVQDDGRGFDVDAVNARRLGIRISLRQRIESVGGTAEVSSQPGVGTLVRLRWVDAAHREVPRESARPEASRDHALFDHLDVRPIAWVGVGAVGIFMLVGVLQMFVTSHVVATAVTIALSGIVVPLSLGRFGAFVPFWRAWSAVAVGLLVCLLGAVAMPEGAWTGHPGWWLGPVTVAAAALLIGGQRAAAWALAVAAALAVVISASLDGQSVLAQSYLALNPVGWLIVVELLLAWIGRVQHDMDIAQRAAEEASTEGAASFGRLVLREVWLADLRAQVDPLLMRIADPHVHLTDADRAACLALEGTLRDNIRAANLSSPSLSAAIMEARLRGVDVTLVDNRGAGLPDAVRKSTLRHLESVVRAAGEGRIVARTAPSGYDDAVTIVVEDSLGSRMTRINNDGMIALR